MLIKKLKPYMIGSKIMVYAWLHSKVHHCLFTVFMHFLLITWLITYTHLGLFYYKKLLLGWGFWVLLHHYPPNICSKKEPVVKFDSFVLSYWLQMCMIWQHWTWEAVHACDINSFIRPAPVGVFTSFEQYSLIYRDSWSSGLVSRLWCSRSPDQYPTGPL